MTLTEWDLFYKNKLTHLVASSSRIIDIGGGLRISRNKGNRYNLENEWIASLMAQSGVAYQILDPVPNYNPDIVGDIHNLPFRDNELDAIVCIAVLEHVEDPQRAVSEMFRTLKENGLLFVYVPFLYYYHAENGYYRDYWRFSKDAIEIMFKGYSQMEICNVRGATETLFWLSPLGKWGVVRALTRRIDCLTRKSKSSQTSGYYVFLRK